MAAFIDSALTELLTKVGDVIRCSVCLETFTEPKILPCTHTFCLQCLDRHCEGKGQNVPCPLCRKMFIIPPGGNIKLPNNIFVLPLLPVKQLTNGAENDMPSSAKKVKFSMKYCDEHPNEENRLYCCDCKMVTCNACIINKHRRHDLIHVDMSMELFRQQLKNDVDRVSSCPLKKLESIKQLEMVASDLMEKVTITESGILQQCDQLISRIEHQKDDLMQLLHGFKDKILKKLQSEKDEIEKQFVIREDYKKDALEIMEKGTACEISHKAHDLHARADELVKAQEELDSHKLGVVEISFTPSLTKADYVKSYMGKLVIRDELNSAKDSRKLYFTTFLGSVKVFNIIPNNGQSMSGITVLGSDVFVVRQTSKVFVYKSDSFTLSHQLKITGSYDLRGLVSCSNYNCLYAVDHGQKIIYRYDLTNNVATSFSVAGKCCGLSVTKCFHVLATLCDIKRIQEYNTHGSLIREIILDSSIDYPHHCVQLSTGNYVVSHEGTQQRRVCIVDQSGSIIHSYGGSQGSGVGQIYNPYHLAVDVHDNVLVADWDKRVQLLSPTLTYLGDIEIPGHETMEPYYLHFDKPEFRLFIAEWTDGDRVFALDVNDEN